jgi:hypothetical protein
MSGPTMLTERGKNDPGDDESNRGETLHGEILRLFAFASRRFSRRE